MHVSSLGDKPQHKFVCYLYSGITWWLRFLHKIIHLAERLYVFNNIVREWIIKSENFLFYNRYLGDVGREPLLCH